MVRGWSGEGGRGVQLRPTGERRGVSRDALVVALTVAVVVVLGALLLTLVVGPSLAPRVDPGGPRTAGGEPAIDVPIDRVLSRLPDGREALGSFTLRFRESAAPARLKEVAARTPTPIPFDQLRSEMRPTPSANQSEALLRDRVGEAIGGFSYHETTGEIGKERLRRAIHEAVNQALPDSPVDQVFIREWIVQ